MHYFRDRIELFSEYLEIFITVIIILGITAASIQLVIDIISIIRSLFDSSIPIPYEEFLGGALKLIIGLEFVNMLIRKTPDAVVEVLLFAIARKLIVSNTSHLEVIIGIGAIVCLFVVRRFLLFSDESSKNHL